jgi:WD40 repeat protein
VFSVGFIPDGKMLASGSTLSGEIKLWDVLTGKETATLQGHTSGVLFSVAFSPDGKTLASGSWDQATGGTFKLWDVAMGQERATLLDQRDPHRTVSCVVQFGWDDAGLGE